MSTYSLPGATEDYTKAREALLEQERDLRDHVERVAATRRSLPRGPVVEDYEFIDREKRVKLSDLFSDGKPYLVMYHLMYWQDDKEFCPMCSMWVDGWDGIAHHVEQRANIVVASLAPPDVLAAWQRQRGWNRIRILADADDRFAKDTGAAGPQGNPISTVLVFEKTADGIRHVYTAHPEFGESDSEHRGIDQLCATWHIFDLLPSGRGDWNAANDYAIMKPTI